MSLIGSCAILLFAAVPGLVVGVLYGPKYASAQPYMLAMGFTGLGVSLSNLLVQVFMAVHDRVFIIMLAAGCALQSLLIVVFHASVGQVVEDVLVAVLGLLAALVMRFLVLLPRLRPEMLLDEGPEP